jgi:cytochrome c oxidase cbb3-type subunit 2
LWANGGTHLILALGAGLLIDAKRARCIAIISFLLLALAVFLLDNRFFGPSQLASIFYCAGVSLYSTALIAYPLMYEREGELPIAQKAARLYAIAGWIASALGIGMVENMHKIPPLFIFVAGIIFLILYAPRRLTGLLLLSVFFSHGGMSYAEPSAAEGRKVYIQEGCINCHSQYVRPFTRDEEMWGPLAKDPTAALEQTPPLIGNRRVGPDLQNIGNRRSPQWHRLHFDKPQDLSPGTKMPCYAHLFQGPDSPGESLIAYLMSLGRETTEERLQFVYSWRPSDIAPIPMSQASKMFQSYCSQCHPVNETREPKLAKFSTEKAPNLFRDRLAFYDDESEDLLAVYRIIKFGIPGALMPGHEYFHDAEILGIGSYIQKERQKNQSGAHD